MAYLESGDKGLKRVLEKWRINPQKNDKGN